VPRSCVEAALDLLEAAGRPAAEVGSLVAGRGRVHIVDTAG